MRFNTNVFGQNEKKKADAKRLDKWRP